MSKYHVSPEGVMGRCKAKTDKSCPFTKAGGEHFSTITEANARREEILSNELGEVKQLRNWYHLSDRGPVACRSSDGTCSEGSHYRTLSSAREAYAAKHNIDESSIPSNTTRTNFSKPLNTESPRSNTLNRKLTNMRNINGHSYSFTSGVKVSAEKTSKRLLHSLALSNPTDNAMRIRNARLLLATR